jgi:hypothetical protein
MSIYKAFKTMAQILILLINITLAILNKCYYNNITESSLLLIKKR